MVKISPGVFVICGVAVGHFDHFIRHFERSARPGASVSISCQASNPGLGQGEIFNLPNWVMLPSSTQKLEQ